MHVDSGRLKRSLTDVGNDGFYSFIRLTRRGPQVDLGTAVDYSPYMNARRKFIRFTKQDVKIWTSMLAKWMAKNK